MCSITHFRAKIKKTIFFQQLLFVFTIISLIVTNNIHQFSLYVLVLTIRIFSSRFRLRKLKTLNSNVILLYTNKNYCDNEI